MNPKISILTISKDREKFLANAIQSALDQTFTDWELIFIDDASKDNTQKIVNDFSKKDPRIHYFKNENTLGISKSRNKGIKLSKGNYIAVLDSDDYWIDQYKLQKQYDYLESNTTYSLIGTGMRIVDEKNVVLKKVRFVTNDAEIRRKILSKNQFAHSSVLMSKSTVVEVGGYDETLDFNEDLDLFLKLGQKGCFTNLPNISLSYTKHSGSITSQRKKAMAVNQLKLIKKYSPYYPNSGKSLLMGIFRIFKSSL